jgi:hypothetical protein
VELQALTCGFDLAKREICALTGPLKPPYMRTGGDAVGRDRRADGVVLPSGSYETERLGLLATCSFADLPAALREDGSATLDDERCRNFVALTGRRSPQLAQSSGRRSRRVAGGPCLLPVVARGESVPLGLNRAGRRCVKVVEECLGWARVLWPHQPSTDARLCTCVAGRAVIALLMTPAAAAPGRPGMSPVRRPPPVRRSPGPIPRHHIVAGCQRPGGSDDLAGDAP